MEVRFVVISVDENATPKTALVKIKSTDCNKSEVPDELPERRLVVYDKRGESIVAPYDQLPLRQGWARYMEDDSGNCQWELKFLTCPVTPVPYSIRKWTADNTFIWGYAVDNGAAGFRRVRISPFNGLIYGLHYYSSSASSVTSGLYKFTTGGSLIDNIHIPHLGAVADAQMDMDIDDIDGSIVVAGWTDEPGVIGIGADQRIQSYDADLVNNNHNLAYNQDAYQNNSVKTHNGQSFVTKVHIVPPGSGTHPAANVWNQYLTPFFHDPPNDHLARLPAEWLERPFPNFSYWTMGITVGDDGSSYGTCKHYVNVNGDPDHYASGTVIKWEPSPSFGVLLDVVKTSAAPLTSKSPIHYHNGYIWFIDGDLTLHKYNAATMTPVWNSTANQFGYIEDIANDADGNIYLTGMDRQALFPESPDNTWCIQSDGTPIWSHNISGDQHSIAVDQNTGEYYTSGWNDINLADFT